MHLRVSGTWALLGGTSDGTPRERVAQAHGLRGKLWNLIPFLKTLGRLAIEHPDRTRQLWAEALQEPMPLGCAPVGMPRVPVEEPPA